MLPDRPVLSFVALVACFAGGTATRNMAGVPLPLGEARFAPGWDLGAPAEPALALSSVSAPRVRADYLPAVSATARAERLALPLPVLAKSRVKPLPIKDSPAAVQKVVGKVAVATPDAATPQPFELAFADGAAAPVTSGSAVLLPGVDAAVPPSAGLAAADIAAAAAVPGSVPIADEPLKLITSPELRRFDLATFKRPVAPARLAAAKIRSAKAAAPAAARTKDRLIDDTVYHQASIVVGGQASGDIAVRIGPDMKPSVKVGDLLGLVSAQMDPQLLAQLSAASSAGDYVSFATLRSAGFDVSYNAAADSIAISVSK